MCCIFNLVQVPKLDAVGSNPISRSTFSCTYKELVVAGNPLFEVTRQYHIQN